MGIPFLNFLFLNNFKFLEELQNHGVFPYTLHLASSNVNIFFF